LLGIYLGDGTLSHGRRDVWRLRISMDSRYPRIAERVGQAIEDVSAHHAGVIRRTTWIEINAYWKHWVCAFPQHGSGPKHLRTIQLARWQEHAVRSFPDEFVAGLLHSDGCRCVNRVCGREYPRYFLTNRSADIRSLFAEACDRMGVASRDDGRRNVSVARRESVELLDRWIGPKR
jgi:hypothetical protein